MILYHVSLEIVEVPEIRMSRRTLDYGSGFYTTTSYEQAEAWVKRRMSESKASNGFVNIYDYTEPENLNILKFLFLRRNGSIL